MLVFSVKEGHMDKGTWLYQQLQSEYELVFLNFVI